MSKFSRAGAALLFLTGLTFSCSKPLPSLEGFDHEGWKKDRNGCHNIRVSMIRSLEIQKSKLEALDEMDIVTLLGKPDRNELYKRNQKFFYYFIEPGPGCTREQANPKKLAVRFNAVGLAKEVTIE